MQKASKKILVLIASQDKEEGRDSISHTPAHLLNLLRSADSQKCFVPSCSETPFPSKHFRNWRYYISHNYESSTARKAFKVKEICTNALQRMPSGYKDAIEYRVCRIAWHCRQRSSPHDFMALPVSMGKVFYRFLI